MMHVYPTVGYLHREKCSTIRILRCYEHLSILRNMDIVITSIGEGNILLEDLDSKHGIIN